MHTYHIVFKENKADHMSKGKNYTADDAIDAIISFNLEHKHKAIFIACYDTDVLADIKGGEITNKMVIGNRNPF